ncbi:MAG: class IV adenylate cyclase [Clostridiales bacterium]|nr:class IV adenylate cyclase [Clostridiales bacterium]
MADKEIEVKFKIEEKTKQELMAFLSRVATKTVSSHQIDTYYVPSFKNFEVDGQTRECVRIREEGEKCVLCYKKIHYEAEPIYCDEYETEISSKDQTEKILFALGFSVQMIIDKQRESYYHSELEFDFDSIKGLGEFMEVEVKGEDASLDKIFSFVESYGLTKEDVTYDGVQMLMKEAMQRKQYNGD